MIYHDLMISKYHGHQNIMNYEIIKRRKGWFRFYDYITPQYINNIFRALISKDDEVDSGFIWPDYYLLLEHFPATETEKKINSASEGGNWFLNKESSNVWPSIRPIWPTTPVWYYEHRTRPK